MTDLLHPEEALSALLDGELGEDDAAVVRAHVVGCAHCAAELDAVRETRAALRSLPAVEPPDGFFEALLAAVPDRHRAAGPMAPVAHLPRRRRVPLVNAAAAVAAGLALVVGFGSHQAQAVSPQVSGAVERHASTLSAVSAGFGGPDPIVAPGEVSPSTLPRRSTSVSPPFAAPPELAGYKLVGAFRAPEGVQLLYEKGRYGLSVFEQEGTLDFADLPAQGARIKLGGRDAWRWDGGTVAGRVVVAEWGDLVVTIVADESGAVALAAAEASPGSPHPAIGTRLRRACGDVLDTLSPTG